METVWSLKKNSNCFRHVFSLELSVELVYKSKQLKFSIYFRRVFSLELPVWIFYLSPLCVFSWVVGEACLYKSKQLKFSICFRHVFLPGLLVEFAYKDKRFSVLKKKGNKKLNQWKKYELGNTLSWEYFFDGDLFFPFHVIVGKYFFTCLTFLKKTFRNRIIF